MTNTVFYKGESLPEPDDGFGELQLLSTLTVAELPRTIELEIELSDRGAVRRLRGSGATRVAALIDALNRSGLDVSAPEREVHDWDGASATVTSYLSCRVAGHAVWGAGVARDRAEASMRAIVSACSTARQLVGATA